MKLRLDLFFKELLLFGLTLAIGIFSAYRTANFATTLAIPEVRFGWGDAVFIAAVALFLIFSSRFKKVARFSFKLFLVLVVFSGAGSVFGSFVHTPWDLYATILVIMAFLFIRNVLIHNLGIILGVAGIGSVLGLALTPKTVVIAMVALSFYDIIAIYVTKHMVKMAKAMMESGATFGFIIPSRLAGFFAHRVQATAQVGDQFMVLGSGDIGLPVVLASSVARYSVQAAIVVGIFSTLGLLATHLIFVNQKERKPMAALPPIATMSIIGYLITLI